MKTINSSRWGIISVAILMLFVTMINTSINGQKNSFYYAVWIFVAWYGYKGNLEQIKSWMKFLIVANILAMLWIVMFIEDDVTNLVIKGATKESMAIGILVMLIPKIFLYMYCNKEINKNSEPRLSGTSHFEYEGMHSQYQTNQQYKNLTDDALLTEAVLGDEKSQFKIGQQYWLGENRMRDATVAYAWLRIAKESGSEAARFYLDNTVFKQLHQQDIDNSIKLHESLKQAIKRRDVNLCELLIRKSLDDRNVIQDSNNKIEINFSLSTQEYKEKYGVNDYDFAKAINEMNGVLKDLPLNKELMSSCQASTTSLKQAEKKYTYTRAYEISKSLDRDAPHIVKSDASKLFPQEMMDVFGERQSEKKPYKSEDTESFSKWAITNIGKGLIVGLALMFVIVGVINLLANSTVPTTDKKEEKISNKSEDSKPNFFFNDMTYDLKNCEIKDEKTEAIHISKLQTSNNERTSVIYGDKKRAFAGCLLFGRDYTCTDAEDNKKIKIIFDVIYENLTFQKFRNNEINENDLEVEISCEAFAVYK